MMSEENNDGSDWHSQVLKDYSSICVDDENINSLTFQEPQNENLPHVSNIDESVPFEGQIFSNDGDAYEFYSLFARKNGFSIRREHIYKSCTNDSKKNPSGIYKSEFVCHRGGSVKQRNINEVECQRKRKSSKCNCGAKMLIAIKTIGYEEKWVVTYFNNHHNHE